MTFGEMIESLGKNLGIELTDEGGATAVEIDGTPVVLHAAGDDLILAHADLGDIAPDSRERVLAAAMEANFLYQGTGGATLSVNSQDGHLHIQKYNYLERLDAEKTLDMLTRFAETATAWKRLASDASAELDAPPPADFQLGGYMQV